MTELPSNSHTLSVNDLPMAGCQANFIKAMDKGAVVVCAPTGSGKSTLVPIWIARKGHKVLVVEPRRVACRSLARFVALLWGTPLGEDVGYVVRHEERADTGSRITYVTPGVALRYAQGEALGRFSHVILDEFHERGAPSDLFLAVCQKRRGHHLVVMSATLEVDRLLSHLGATLVEAHTRTHPVEIRYLAPGRLPTLRGLVSLVCEAVKKAMEHPGDILLFLPGKAEIRECLSALQGLAELELIPLHGELPPAAQDRAFQAGPRRRVILSTNVAETSVTLPRIGVVIDTGLERRTRYQDGRAVLALAVIAQSSADQRAGRAGRLMPGLCLRLWGPEAIVEPRRPPEIYRESLVDLALQAAACGESLDHLPFLDPPQSYAVESATDELKRMAALSTGGQITPVGKRMAQLPVGPDLARLLLEGEAHGDQGLLRDLVDLVAALSAGRSLLLPLARASQEIIQARETLVATRCDAAAHILAIRNGNPRSQALHPGVLAEARKISHQLQRLLGLPHSVQLHRHRVDHEGLVRVLLLVHPHWAYVPRARGPGWGNGRREVILGRESLVSQDAQAMAVLRTQAIRGKGLRINTIATMATPCRMQDLLQAGLGQPRLCRCWWEGGKLMGRLQVMYGGRTLDEREEVLEGDLLIEAAAQCFVDGELFAEMARETLEAIDAWNLSCHLHPGKGDPVKPLEWVRNRFMELGVETGEDLQAILSADLVFAGLTPSQREELERDFPRRLHLGDMSCEVEYRPHKREVILVKSGGTRTTPPPTQYLPAWPGWRILFRDRNRTVLLRD